MPVNGSEAAVETPATIGKDELDIQGQLARILKGSAPVRRGTETPPAPPAPVAAPVQPMAPAPAAPVAPVDSNILEFQEPPPEIIGLTSPTPPAEPAIEPQQPAAPTQDGIVEPPEIKTNQRAKTAWEMVRKENRDLKSQLEAARQQAREAAQNAEQAAAQKTQREAELEKRNEELENEIGRWNLRSTREFQQKYLAPVNQELNKAVAALVKAGQSPEDAKALVGRLMKEGAQSEDLDSVLGDLPRFAQGVVSTAIFNAQEYTRQANEAESTWKQTKVALESDSAKLQDAAFKKRLVTDTVGAAEELSEKYGSWVFRPDPGNNEWMRQREKLVLEAQSVLQNGSDRDVARLVLEGAAANFYRRYAEMLHEQLEATRGELAARDSARPRIGSGGRGPSAPAPAPQTRKPMSIEAGLAAALQATQMANAPRQI